MNHLEKYIEEISKLCMLYHVKKLYAFGSVLTNSWNAQSDIDLIVDFEKIELSHYADNYYDLKFSLEDIFKRPVDLLEVQAIKNPYFLTVVKDQQKLIYGQRNENVAL